MVNRTRHILLSLAFCIASLTTTLAAQAIHTQPDMHASVVSLYNFSPHTSTEEVRTAKSAEMDAFWKQVTADPKTQLPLLRVELADYKNPPFFMWDGSALLLSLSHTPADEALAAKAMPHVDLADVAPRGYFYAVHALSMDGTDTTEAALHVLDDPKFAVVVPQHAMTLDQASVLMYLLLPVAQDRWIESARKRLAVEKDDTAANSLLLLFFLTQTTEGDAALADASKDPAKSAAIRDAATHYQQAMHDALKLKFNVKGTEASIREERRKRLAAVSDEAIDDVQQMTGRLVQLRNVSAK